ncbi:TAXI family TRAP transporter solute-binding subunit [Sulfitobacter sp. HNIBRBA3233]|uniref:TAXI family TRAP transporter solute-binding subunit n=1 Tax=Sulfitobacter marinivivus TaxID=3158558 RepID=UPI0032DF8914
MKSTKKFTQLVLGSALATFGLSAAAMAQDYDWPRLLVIGTPGTSTGSFASTNGWGPTLQEETGTTVRIVPEDSEPMRYKRLTDREDIAISSVSASEMAAQTEGFGGYASAKPLPQRILWHHNDTPWGFVVSGDSDIQSLDDIAKGGVRVTSGVFSPVIVAVITEALPGFIGLSPEEAQEKIEFVPASSYGENCRSVVEGKSDVAYCSPISSVLSEMEGSPGSIRWLPMDPDDTEAWDRFLNVRPMTIPTKISFGVKTAQGVNSMTSNFVYSVPATADTDFAYNMAKWLHTSFDNYKGTHALATRMSVDLFREFLNANPIPVHEGTVKYLREIGQWTEEDDAWNEEAIALMDRWIEARNEGLKTAAEQGVRADFQDEEFLAIMEKATEGLPAFRSRL